MTPTIATITAYRTPENSFYPEIVPASADRHWMDEGTRGWANRCLPLRIANANGWFVLNPAAIEVEWNGQRALDALTIKSNAGEDSLAQSMFGFGIITFVIPYLFRTPAGVNMLARGPANQPKDGIAPLEGIIETDWLPFAFTMNWQVTRPGVKIRFEQGEPIAMLTPLRRGDTESFMPEIRNLTSEPALQEKFDRWLLDRQEAARLKQESNYQAKVKQGHYIRGEDHAGARATEHQANLKVKQFVEIEPAVVAPKAAAAKAGSGSSGGGGGVWDKISGLWK
jgi:Family of unknown function (DUF6065)